MIYKTVFRSHVVIPIEVVEDTRLTPFDIGAFCILSSINNGTFGMDDFEWFATIHGDQLRESLGRLIKFGHVIICEEENNG